MSTPRRTQANSAAGALTISTRIPRAARQSRVRSRRWTGVTDL